ncbi:sigma-70 family RNA polymerase sigma factor [Brachybacterium halotolerans subsp. kimchii]|uniref:RNA polymerase sigma factor n=1 Tax=Brachybacterium halotolerans TaxID=2795215 RepID=UPI001E4CFC58|nr:sigma-70 family RNA polymerase sigma factor [Brachybacterium halotolerans]UEJ81528.1 sigma-70 family RNA polymerase sigma factor [Brachybacterium halotolerans subsp. kimchii]
MSSSGTRAAASALASVEAAHREHWASVLTTTLSLTRDLDLAEDCTQEAFAQAIAAWPSDGVPRNPGGWLATAARRRALDAMRRSETLRRKLPVLVWDEPATTGTPATTETTGTPAASTVASASSGATPSEGTSLEGTPSEAAPSAEIEDEQHAIVLDEQLRLIFLAAHPALAPESRIALTLRLVGGMTTADIAAVFLVGESTMAARLTRAKKRIRLSRIPCRVPGADELDGRVGDVLDVLSVLLTTMDADARPGRGVRSKRGGDGGAQSVVDAAVRMLETLVRLLPGQTEPLGLLAQALALRARASTRTDAVGRPVALAEQDRHRWDRPLLQRADALVIDGLSRGGRGPYLIQGAIACAVALPERHEHVDWDEVVELYDALLVHWPTAIVRLGRAVALTETAGPGTALAQLEGLAADLEGHRPFHVIRGDLLERMGDSRSAAAEFRAALALPGRAGEDELLEERALRSPGPDPLG